MDMSSIHLRTGCRLEHARTVKGGLTYKYDSPRNIDTATGQYTRRVRRDGLIPPSAG